MIVALSACMVPSARAMSEEQAGGTPAAAPATATTAAAIDQGRVAAGRDLFASWGCTACHTLADARSNGAVGPSFDGNATLTEAFIASRVTNGQGAMPAFGGQLTEKEIADLAYYIAHVKK